MTLLMLVMPALSRWASSMPRLLEKTAPASPYVVSLARSTASSASRPCVTVSVGPKVSSWIARLSSGTSTSTVGST